MPVPKHCPVGIKTLPCRYQNTNVSVSVVFTTNKILFFGVWFRNDLFDWQPCRIHHHALSVMHYYVLCSYLQYENSPNLYSFKHIWNKWWRKLIIIIIIVILKRVNWKKNRMTSYRVLRFIEAKKCNSNQSGWCWIYALFIFLFAEPFNNQCPHHIETSQLICRANQLTGFYMMGTLVVKGFS